MGPRKRISSTVGCLKYFCGNLRLKHQSQRLESHSLFLDHCLWIYSGLIAIGQVKSCTNTKYFDQMDKSKFRYCINGTIPLRVNFIYSKISSFNITPCVKNARIKCNHAWENALHLFSSVDDWVSQKLLWIMNEVLPFPHHLDSNHAIGCHLDQRTYNIK